MTGKIIEFSARQPALILCAVALAAIAGGISMRQIPLDALPDLSETQVILQTRWDRSPDIVEDQVTYPMVTALLGWPKVKDVRGFSDFGYSYVYVIFEQGTDLYWARTRTLEALSRMAGQLPPDVHPELGPDASGLGWVFQYAVVDPTGKHNLAELRSIQDFFLRFQLQSVPGVSEVAPLGGFVRQYQIQLDPERMQAHSIPMGKVLAAVRASNNDVGGRLLEMGGREYMVRGRGYLKSAADIEQIVLSQSTLGAPVTVHDVGSVALGPDLRRGVADLNGQGEAVSGIVVMRAGENALAVIERVKAKLALAEASLPPGVKIVTVYDRSELILASIQNLKVTLLEELLVVSAIILVFLWHVPSAVVPILTVSAAVLIAFLPMRLMGITANIMSLGGIAIAVGAMVDASIVVVEQTHKRLAGWQRTRSLASARDVVVEAVKEVGGAGFFSLLVIAVSFLPVLALEGQEGRLFTPLALTKTAAILVAAVLAITLDPAIRVAFTHMEPFRFRPLWLARAVSRIAVGTIRGEESHPLSRFLIRLYQPVVAWTLQHKAAVFLGAAALVAATIPVYRQLGSEFMPPLDEGSLLFMPTTAPGISIAEAARVLQIQNRIIANFPEVERVFGKAGRAETATDPAPLSMMETVVLLKPQSQWPKVHVWFDGLPEWAQAVGRHVTPDHLSTEELIRQLDVATRLPGVSNAWTMPVKARIDMQSTGIRTAVGIKVSGPDLKTIERLGEQIERVLPQAPGTRSVFAERTGTGYYLDFDFKRDRLAQYGLTIGDAQVLVANAIGGENITTVIKDLERYPVNVRYQRSSRGDPDQLRRVLVPVGQDRQIPISEIADVRLSEGPSMLRNENGLLTGYVFVDTSTNDLGRYVEDATKVIHNGVTLPPGFTVTWSGQYEAMLRVRDRLKIVVPLTLVLIFALVYVNTRSAAMTILVLLAVPFSCLGAFWLLWALGYNLSIGAWIGLIALMGVDAETGIFMLLYLDLAVAERIRRGMLDGDGLREAILEGAAKRVRPKVMTVLTMLFGLAPVMWSTGAGADVMKRIAAPMIGGIVTSFLLELAVYPPAYELWIRWRQIRAGAGFRRRIDEGNPISEVSTICQATYPEAR